MADEKNEEVAERTLAEIQAEERDYYLGKTDTIPGTDMTVAQGKKAYGVEKAKFEADQAKRMERYADRAAKAPAPEPEPETEITALPSREDLEKLDKNNLIEQAVKEGLDVDRGDKMAVIIDKLIAHRGE